ncbi:MAG: hypothetical protein OES20_00020 [Gammaproteobacteria bacterium]|nr:hypothetical protein [Gammaproteobacteria bacterium]
MKAMACISFLSLTMSLISCSIGGISSSDDDAAAVSAPSTLAGKTYRVTAESGSGEFSKTGTFTVVFLSSQPWYTVQGDGVNFPDSWGMYIYSSNGASGTVKVTDSVGGSIAYSFTFNTAFSGTYVATETTTAGVNSTQAGTFNEL